jgi:predicted nucleotidyltransferase
MASLRPSPLEPLPLAEVKARTAGVFEAFPDILAVYLFGSFAAARAKPGSDLDLAVVPASTETRKRRLELLTELARIGLDKIDLVFLDRHDLVLRYEALRPNCLIYARDDFDAGSYFSSTMRQYFDLLPHLHKQREAYRRRILE